MRRGQKSTDDRDSAENIAPECTIYFTVCRQRVRLFHNVMNMAYFPVFLGFDINMTLTMAQINLSPTQKAAKQQKNTLLANKLANFVQNSSIITQKIEDVTKEHVNIVLCAVVIASKKDSGDNYDGQWWQQAGGNGGHPGGHVRHQPLKLPECQLHYKQVKLLRNVILSM